MSMDMRALIIAAISVMALINVGQAKITKDSSACMLSRKVFLGLNEAGFGGGGKCGWPSKDKKQCYKDTVATELGYNGYEAAKEVFEKNPAFQKCWNDEKLNKMTGQWELHNEYMAISPCFDKKCELEKLVARELEKLVARVQGCYDNKLWTGNAKNDWHYVKITWDPKTEKFTWKNKAGAEWPLYPIPSGNGYDTKKLRVADSPYSDQTEVGMEMSNGKSIIRWLNEPYTKVSNNKDCTP